jgi:hypothetical protein
MYNEGLIDTFYYGALATRATTLDGGVPPDGILFTVSSLGAQLFLRATGNFVSDLSVLLTDVLPLPPELNIPECPNILRVQLSEPGLGIGK